MKNNEQNTEKAILEAAEAEFLEKGYANTKMLSIARRAGVAHSMEAAEAEFLEKGYANTKMLSIARRAGVAHSMLHYYYRSKENLFLIIFMKKVQVMLPAYEDLFNEALSFEEVLRRLRDARDRYFWSQNPKMPYFVLTEILANKKNREMFLEVLQKAVPRQLARMKELLEAEIAKGAVRPISFMDFMMLLVTIDASSLSAISICRDVHELDKGIVERLQETYREHNMQLMMEALRP